MLVEKVNKYTWVVGKSTGKTKERFSSERINNRIEAVGRKVAPKESKVGEYRDFCREVFKDKKMLCIREFRKVMKEKFNKSNTNWYITRFKDLEFITESSKIIKPGNKL